MGKRSFFWNLAKDPTANVIVISAASLIPLIGMVGGAVDASRYYMTNTRLQAACDAGALAARRAMSDDNFNGTHRQIGENFFDQNYEAGLFGLENLSRQYTSDGDGEVQGTATGELPTSLMHIFGYDDFNVSVECSAEINISNTDIMFVLDVTGSMNCAPDNPGGGNCGNTEDAGAKIIGMRDAVMSFYDTVDAATSPNAQVRYGAVPYASNVNVGDSLRTEWMATNHTFQSRHANFEENNYWQFVSATIVNITNTSQGSLLRTEDDRVKISSEADCNALRPADRVEFDDNLGRFNQQSQTVDGTTRTTRYNDTNEDILIYRGFATYEHHNNVNKRRCTYGYEVYDGRGDAIWDEVEEYVQEVNFVNWTYRPIDTANPPANQLGQVGWEDVDLSTLYDDNEIDLPIGTNGAMTSVRWDGCIEEAETVATDDFSDVNDSFRDLNINLVPDADDEYWKPVLFNATWKRENGGNTLSNLTQTGNENRPSYSCPAAAFRLAALENSDIASTDGVMRTREDLQNYVDDLQGRSNTYHDIGMIWGARFIAPDGIFSADNRTAPNGDAIARHIVFMTDGLLAPNVEVYGTYGVEWWTRRVTNDGSGGQATDRHSKRFQAACQAAKNENITVWVVAFGTTLTSNLSSCASPGRAFQADDSEALQARFEEIAQTIAALRLTS